MKSLTWSQSKQITYFSGSCQVPDLVPEQPSVLEQAITMLMKSRVQTPTDIVEAIKWPPHEIEALCNLRKGTLSSEGKVIPVQFKGSTPQ